MMRKIVTANFEDNAIKEKTIELHDLGSTVRNDEFILAAKIDLLRDGYTRAFIEKATFTVREAK